MARSSLANSLSNLNLSRRQIAVFKGILLIGNQMAEALRHREYRRLVKKDAIKLARRWERVIVALAKMLV